MPADKTFRDRSDNAAAAAKQAHWAVLGICLAICAALFVPRDVDTRAALAEATFLRALGASDDRADTVGFLEAEVRARADSIVPAEVRSFLNENRERLVVVWEEPAALRTLKESYHLATVPVDKREEAFWRFYGDVRSQEDGYSLAWFTPNPTYLGTECAEADLRPYVWRYPGQGGDGDYFLGAVKDLQDRRFELARLPVRDVFKWWDYLSEIHAWYPLAPGRGRLELPHIALKLEMPARVETWPEGRAEDDCSWLIKISGVHVASSLLFLARDSVADGETVQHALSLEGEVVLMVRALEGAPIGDWLLLDDNNDLFTPRVQVHIPFDGTVRVLDGQGLLLSAAPGARRPRTFQQGEAQKAFPNLANYVTRNPEIEADPLNSVISRLEQAAAADTPGTIPILGIHIPINQVRTVGFALLILAQLYLALHVRQLHRILRQHGPTSAAWIGLHDDKASALFFLSSVTILPLAAGCGLLILSLPPQWRASSIVLDVLLVVVVALSSVWTFREVSTLRLAVRESVQPGDRVASAVLEG